MVGFSAVKLACEDEQIDDFNAQVNLLLEVNQLLKIDPRETSVELDLITAIKSIEQG